MLYWISEEDGGVKKKKAFARSEKCKDILGGELKIGGLYGHFPG